MTRSVRARGPFFLAAMILVMGCTGTIIESNESLIQVATVEYGQGQAVNIFIILPAETPGAPAPVIFALPWGDGSANLVVSLLRSYWDVEAPARGYIVVGVEVLGSSLATEAAAMIPAIFSWMDENLGYDPGRVVATGASLGGSGLFFAGISAPDRFAGLLGMPGEYAGEAAELAGLAGKPVWLMVGELDTTWRERTDATREKLESVGAQVVVEVLEGQTHVLEISQPRLMDWVDLVVGR